MQEFWAILKHICLIIVPRWNEVAEGGYWITLRPSASPSVRPFVCLEVL